MSLVIEYPHLAYMRSTIRLDLTFQDLCGYRSCRLERTYLIFKHYLLRPHCNIATTQLYAM